MRLDALSGFVALLLCLPALQQVAEGRLEISAAATRITIVLLACAAIGSVLQSIVEGYQRQAAHTAQAAGKQD